MNCSRSRCRAVHCRNAAKPSNERASRRAAGRKPTAAVAASRCFADDNDSENNFNFSVGNPGNDMGFV